MKKRSIKAWAVMNEGQVVFDILSKQICIYYKRSEARKCAENACILTLEPIKAVEVSITLSPKKTK